MNGGIWMSELFSSELKVSLKLLAAARLALRFVADLLMGILCFCQGGVILFISPLFDSFNECEVSTG